MNGVSDESEASAEKPLKKQPTTSLAVSYFIARFGIFVVILAIFWLIGFEGLPGALAAAIVSIPVSFFALGKMRVRVATAMAERKHSQLSMRDEFRSTGKDDTK